MTTTLKTAALLMVAALATAPALAAGPGQSTKPASFGLQLVQQHGHGMQQGEGPALPDAVADVSVTVGDLTLRGPWARASMGMARAGAAFLAIDNAGDADRLIAAMADIADRVELHTHLMEDGVMRMREVEGGIEIPAGETTMLAPGGLHLMFLGLVAPLDEGASFPVTLTFEEAGDVTVEVQILTPAAGAMHGRNGG